MAVARSRLGRLRSGNSPAGVEWGGGKGSALKLGLQSVHGQSVLLAVSVYIYSVSFGSGALLQVRPIGRCIGHISMCVLTLHLFALLVVFPWQGLLKLWFGQEEL